MKFTKPQSIALDLARGIAAQLVLVGHAMSAAGLQSPNWLYQNLGVCIFFLLSGLLVTHSVLTKDATYSFTNYLVDRGARIFVPYVPAIVFIVVVDAAFRLGGFPTPLTLVGNLFMLEDYPLFHYLEWFPSIERIGTGPQFWTVVVEWWFYMSAGAILFAGRLPRWA